MTNSVSIVGSPGLWGLVIGMSGNENELPEEFYDIPIDSLTGSQGLLVQTQLLRRCSSWLQIDNDHGQRYALLRDVMQSAWAHGIETKATVSQFEDEILPLGTGVIQTISYALGGGLDGHEGWKIKRRRLDHPEDLWVHKLEPDQHVREGRTPYIERHQIEAATEDYLSMPYRVPSLERLLVDILIAMVTYAFLDEAIGEKARVNAKAMKEFPNSDRPLDPSIYAEHPERHVVRALGYVALILLAAGLSIWFFAKEYVPPDIRFWASATVVVLGAILLWISMGSRRYLSGQEKLRNESVQKTISTLLSVYAELQRGELVDTVRLRGKAEDAEQNGVVWPPMLYSVLDDNLRRSGHI